MSFSGIDIRRSGGSLIFRSFLQDGNSPVGKVTSGTTALSLYELQSDGSLKSYDFSSNTFKTTTLTTATLSLTHQTGNNATVNTGVWTGVLTTLTGFTIGNVYFAAIDNSGASPPDQMREFQYGGADGDLALDSSGRTDLVNAPNATAITAIQLGLATSANASSLLSAINNLNNLSALANFFVESLIVPPPSGTLLYPFAIVIRDSEGNLVDLDTSPTVTVTNGAGTDRSSNLSSVTHASTGVYTGTYTSTYTDVDEGLSFVATGAVSSVARRADAKATVASVDTITALAAIKSQTDLIGTNAMDSPNTAPVTAQTAAAQIGSAGAGLTAITNQTAKIGQNTGDSPNAVTAQGNASTAAAQATSASSYAAATVTTNHFNTIVGSPTGGSVSADIAAVKSDTHTTLQIEQGDEYTDTTSTPWNWVLVVNGTGAPVGTNELLRKKLKTPAGVNIMDDATVIGQKESA